MGWGREKAEKGEGMGVLTIHPPPPRQKRAIEETKAIFAPLTARIAEAVKRVEGMLVGPPPPCFPLDFFLFRVVVWM